MMISYIPNKNSVWHFNSSHTNLIFSGTITINSHHNFNVQQRSPGDAGSHGSAGPQGIQGDPGPAGGPARIIGNAGQPSALGPSGDPGTSG